jgi:hypothetical protein
LACPRTVALRRSWSPTLAGTALAGTALAGGLTGRRGTPRSRGGRLAAAPTTLVTRHDKTLQQAHDDTVLTTTRY